MRHLLAFLPVCLALAAPAQGQSEAALKDFFEGKSVRVKSTCRQRSRASMSTPMPAAPEKTAERSEGSLKVLTATYAKDDQRITAEFVEGVLIKYSISSR